MPDQDQADEIRAEYPGGVRRDENVGVEKTPSRNGAEHVVIREKSLGLRERHDAASHLVEEVERRLTAQRVAHHLVRVRRRWPRRSDTTMAMAAAGTVQIAKTPGVRGERARIEGSRSCVVDVVQAHKTGGTPERIRDVYPDLNLAQISRRALGGGRRWEPTGVGLARFPRLRGRLGPTRCRSV